MKHHLTIGLLAAVFALFAAPAVLAQGADDCGSAQQISGFGPFNYDTTFATTDGYDEGMWSIPGLDNSVKDVWFRWVAPATKVYHITCCYVGNQDANNIAVYYDECPTGPGRAIAAEDFGCGTYIFGELEFGAVAGQAYKFRFGNTVTQNNAKGIFTISEIAGPAVLDTVISPLNGKTYLLLDNAAWSVAQATAVGLGGNLVTVNDQAENDWLNTTFGNWGGKSRSLWIGYTDSKVEGVWKWISGETPGYENWSVGSPNNGNQYEHYAHFRSNYTDGSWGDLIGWPEAGFFYKEVLGVVEIDVPEPLVGTPDQISVTAGGSQTLALNVGPAGAGALYLMLGTTSGTTPGLTIDGQLLPLNVDGYTLHILGHPNQAPLLGSVGFLDANGKATATFVLGASQAPAVVGLTAHHAFLTVDLLGPVVSMASNAVPVTFVP